MADVPFIAVFIIIICNLLFNFGLIFYFNNIFERKQKVIRDYQGLVQDYQAAENRNRGISMSRLLNGAIR